MSTRKPRWIPLPLEPAAPWFRLPALTRAIGQYLFAQAQDRPIIGIELALEVVRDDETYPQAESWALRQMSPDPDERKTIRAAIRKLVKRGLLVPITGGMHLLYTPESYAEHLATVAQPSVNGAPIVTPPSTDGAPIVTQPSGDGAPTGEDNSAKPHEAPSQREREKQRKERERDARAARDPLPADDQELEEGEPDPETSTLELVRTGYKALLIEATGNPPSQSHKLKPHYEAIAAWVDEKNGHAERLVEQLLVGFRRDKWARSKSFPLGALASDPGKYFNAQKKNGSGGGFMPTSPDHKFDGKGTKVSDLGPAPPGEAE